MSVLESVKALKEQTNNKSSESSQGKLTFFSTIPGIVAALTALITAVVSLFNSCQSANNAVLEKMDKVQTQCEILVKVEKEQRINAIDDLKNRQESLKDEYFNTRSSLYDSYRRLERRVFDIEPGGLKGSSLNKKNNHND